MLTRGASVQSRSTARATNPRNGDEIIPTTSTPRVGGTTAGRRRTISMTTSTSMPVRVTSDRKTQCASHLFFVFPPEGVGGKDQSTKWFPKKKTELRAPFAVRC